jgi:hypothetical protein
MLVEGMKQEGKYQQESKAQPFNYYKGDRWVTTPFGVLCERFSPSAPRPGPKSCEFDVSFLGYTKLEHLIRY